MAKKEVIQVAIKVEREDSGANNRVINEANWLKILNKDKIGPKYLFNEGNYLVREFVEGELILDWIKEKNKDEILTVLLDVLNQCYKMDKLGVNKEEMHHPLKHIIIDKSGNALLIDFERCHRTEKPINVTQFIEFICRIKNEVKILNIDVEKLRSLSAEYKKSYDKENFVEFQNYRTF